MGGRSVVFLIASGFTASATSQAKDDFSFILLATTFTTAARVTVGEDKRWGAMEIQTLGAISRKDGKTRVWKLELYSVDCANRGVEEIKTLYNLEIEADKEPRWGGRVNPKYEEGFISKLIKHYPVSEFLTKQYEHMIDGAAEKTKKLLTEAKEKTPEFPDGLVAAVEFACLIIEKGVPPPVAAAKIMDDAGLTDVKTLECSLVFRQDRSAAPVDLTIRFSEATGFVQAQRFWVQKHLITPEKISLTWKDSNIEINRLNGRGSLTAGEFRVEGPCKVVDKTQRQF